MQKTGEKFLRLVDIVSRLRGPGGCPWDQKQTPESFKSYLIEEAHELFETLGKNNPTEVKEELGDLLFQILFINSMYAERGCFTLSDAIDCISEKMIRRHPHVFGDREIGSEDSLRRQWHAIKDSERKNKKEAGDSLSSLPPSMPALRRAQRVIERANRIGLLQRDMKEILSIFGRACDELDDTISTGNKDKTAASMGDILFIAVQAARTAGIQAEDALRSATEAFIKRFGTFERLMAKKGHDFSTLDPEQLLALWKETERQPL